jgi:hypothetical protein
MILHKKRRTNKRRYARLATAVAGAAIISAAVLPGIPAIAHATSPAATFSTADTTAAANDPVQVAIDNAGRFGLDSSGHYSLISQSDSKATVRVRSNGQTYKLDMVLSDGNWVVKTIRGIGDMTHPATYVSANSYNYSPLVTNVVNPVATTVTATLGASQQVIYQNNNYDNWLWTANAYPKDMAFGVLTQNPRISNLATPLPSALLHSLNNINFDNRLAVYAHLGTTSGQGYGIGISRIEQNGNDLIVTVRTKSPQPNETMTNTQSDAYVAIDRSMVNMGAPIHVRFVDQSGTLLGDYTVNAG